MLKREDLLAGLTGYAAEDPDEAAALARVRRFVSSREDPFGRKDPEGHITGSAIVARPDGSAFLLVHHRKLGRWLQPGGHSEETDPFVFDTALREAREETGIAGFQMPIGRAIFDVDVHAIPPHGRDPAHSHFDVRFLLTSSASVHASEAEDPGRPMVWLPLPRALEAGIDASLSRALRKAHARLTELSRRG